MTAKTASWNNYLCVVWFVCDGCGLAACGGAVGGRVWARASGRIMCECVLVRLRARAKGRKGEERKGGGKHNFVCDDEDDGNGDAVMWRVAFHEFASTRRARSRDRKRRSWRGHAARACGTQQAAAVAAAVATATAVAMSSASSRHERPAAAAPAPHRRARCRSRRRLVACRETPPREVQR